MNDSEPLVSVIIPIYNPGDYLEQALQSVKNQTYKNLEIICINDGSTDDSLNVMREIAEGDDRFVIIDKENEGYGASCNKGLDVASGEWIAILEPDDWIDLEMYGQMIEYANGFDETIDIIKTPYWRIRMPEDPKQKRLHCSFKGQVKTNNQPFALREETEIITHHPSIWSALYRRFFLQENGIRFPEIPGAGWADNPFMIESTLCAKSIVYLDVPFYNYREDSYEKSKQFALNSPDIPFQRWNDIMDIVEAKGCDDINILRSVYSRGFTYLSGILEFNSMEDPKIRKNVEQMFSRMDPEIVFTERNLSPGSKRLFADVMGLDMPKVSNAAYLFELTKKGFQILRLTGLSETFAYGVRYLKKMSSLSK